VIVDDFVNRLTVRTGIENPTFRQARLTGYRVRACPSPQNVVSPSAESCVHSRNRLPIHSLLITRPVGGNSSRRARDPKRSRRRLESPCRPRMLAQLPAALIHLEQYTCVSDNGNKHCHYCRREELNDPVGWHMEFGQCPEHSAGCSRCRRYSQSVASLHDLVPHTPKRRL